MILVFKTNISADSYKEDINNILTSMNAITKWNFDHWDIDNILRVESNEDCSSEIIHHITKAGYICENLED
jgi:hypothetical protein